MNDVIDITTRSPRPSMQNRIIAISGWRRAGKDTIANYLVSNYGYTKVSFANALKDEVARKYGLGMDQLHDQDLKEKPLLQYPAIPSDAFSTEIHRMLASELRSGYWTPRALCILEGSMARSVAANHWVRQVYESMEPTTKYVISDLRYRTEADTLKALFPREQLMIMRVNRFETIDTNEASERDMDQYKFDLVIGNSSSTVESLHQTMSWVMESHLGQARSGSNAQL